jgi:hypothetical protein
VKKPQNEGPLPKVKAVLLRVAWSQAKQLHAVAAQL